MTASVIKYTVDSELTLKASGSVAITATADSDVVALNRGSGLEGHANALVEGIFTAWMDIIAVDFADADETYVITVKVADTVAKTGNITVVATKAITSADQEAVAFTLDSQQIEMMSAGSPGFLWLTCTLGGTTPSLTYEAYVESVAHA